MFSYVLTSFLWYDVQFLASTARESKLEFAGGTYDVHPGSTSLVGSYNNIQRILEVNSEHDCGISNRLSFHLISIDKKGLSRAVELRYLICSCYPYTGLKTDTH